MKRIPLIVLPLLVAASGFTSCSSVQGIQVPVLKPSAVNLTAYRLLAVDKFDGPGATPLAQQFALALRNAENPATGKAGFEVMDHSEVDRLLDRMRGNSGELDAKSKEVLARWRSVDVILKGTVTDNAVDEKVKVEPTVNEKGHKLVVFTRRAKAFVKLEVHVLDSKDQTVDRVELIGQAQASTQQVNGKPKSIDHANLLANAQAQVIQDYLHRVMPRREYVQVQLYKDKGLPDLQIGNGLAQSGDWQAAHDSYQRALDMATGELAEVRFKPLFNLGVALEFSDRFEDARKTLQEAFRLNQDRLVSAELSRLAQREQESKRLKEQVQNAAPSR